MESKKKPFKKLLFHRALVFLSVIYIPIFLFILPLLLEHVNDRYNIIITLFALFFIHAYALYVFANLLIINNNFSLIGKYERMILTQKDLIAYSHSSFFDFPIITILLYDGYLIIKYFYLIKIYIPFNNIIEIRKNDSNRYSFKHNSPELNKKVFIINEMVFIHLVKLQNHLMN